MSETRELYVKLKYARERIAERTGVKNSLLIDEVPLWLIAKRRPSSKEGFLQIRGVSPTTLELYFESFVKLIHGKQTIDSFNDLFFKEGAVSVYQAFKNRGIQWLYYFSNIKAAPSILKHGIYSRNYIRNSNIKIFDFSNQSVQERRKNVQIQLNDLRTCKGHDVVPFYFVTKTPTLSAVRHLNDKFVFWRVNISIIKQTGIVYGFSDGNLGSGQTKTYFKTEDVEKIDFANLNAPNWTDYPQGKIKRAAEMLIYDRVDPNFIDPRVCVYSKDSKKELLEILGPRAKEIDIHIGGEEYFFE